MKVKVIARLEFELTNYYVTALLVRKGISSMWNANNLVGELHLGYCIHFLIQ